MVKMGHKPNVFGLFEPNFLPIGTPPEYWLKEFERMPLGAKR